MRGLRESTGGVGSLRGRLSFSMVQRKQRPLVLLSEEAEIIVCGGKINKRWPSENYQEEGASVGVKLELREAELYWEVCEAKQGADHHLIF